MPWKRTDPMEERLRFVMEARSEVFQMSELSERYGVSRKTAYKWLQRYREGGVTGLQDRSRAPHQYPRSRGRSPDCGSASAPALGSSDLAGLAASARA